MKYFATLNEREGTCYHEFQKGEWNDEFWFEDSIYLSDDFMSRDLFELISACAPEYDPYGVTVITRRQWNDICTLAENHTPETAAIIAEANIWVQEIFKEYMVFSILGI